MILTNGLAGAFFGGADIPGFNKFNPDLDPQELQF
jgi:hypothetical protein